MGRRILVGSGGKRKGHDEALGEITWPAEQGIKRRKLYVQFLQRELYDQAAMCPQTLVLWFRHAGSGTASVMWGQRPACDQFARAQPDLGAIESTHGH
jgi:hypothetical protein